MLVEKPNTKIRLFSGAVRYAGEIKRNYYVKI
jgi:hypothetical protein